MNKLSNFPESLRSVAQKIIRPCCRLTFALQLIFVVSTASGASKKIKIFQVVERFSYNVQNLAHVRCFLCSRSMSSMLRKMHMNARRYFKSAIQIDTDIDVHWEKMNFGRWQWSSGKTRHSRCLAWTKFIASGSSLCCQWLEPLFCCCDTRVRINLVNI